METTASIVMGVTDTILTTASAMEDTDTILTTIMAMEVIMVEGLSATTQEVKHILPVQF
jgi:hypothetical protein